MSEQDILMDDYVVRIYQKLKADYDIYIEDIPYDNLQVVIANDEGYMSVDFQKQNHSFSLAIDERVGTTTTDEVTMLVRDATNLELFASYQFKDLSNINICQWCYGREKFNRENLIDLKNKGNIINLEFYKSMEDLNITK